MSPFNVEDKLQHPIIKVANTIDDKKSRTFVNKTILDNGFLLIEELWQSWDGSNWVNGEMVTYTYIITGIEQITDGIKTYSLSNNYSNPFNPSTTISYSVPDIAFAKLKVYDVLGSEVATLLNEEKTAGSYEVDFDGSELTSGIYFYRVQTENFVDTKKMILLK